MKKLLLCLFLCSLLPGVAKADFNDGVVALMMSDYDKALSTFLPLAETADHAFAQYFLARMYADGTGVEKNQETAAEWYRKAAEKGVADAQYRLGKMYEDGTGVPGDMEYAYGWYTVAAHLGNPKGVAAAEQTRTRLSAEERVEADKLSRDLIRKYGNPDKGTVRTQ